MNKAMIPRLGTSFLLLIGMSTFLFAQEGSVSGRVTDVDNGDPLVGANVLVVGTNLGAATDVNGEYTISRVPAGAQRLNANYIGYASSSANVDVPADGASTADFTLSVAALNLNEIVVTGAGTAVEKSKIGNSVGIVNMSTLEDAPIGNFSDILQGREKGVIMLPNGGLNGEGASIRIRGTSTLSQSNEPVVYIDGVRVDNTASGVGPGGTPSRLDEINPDAIERIEILKGAAAASLYGTQAANGIIQIFTKQGSISKPQFTVEVSNASSSYDESRWKPNSGFARDQATADTMNKWLGTSVKPYEVASKCFPCELYDKGSNNTISASVRGGAPGATYFASLRYINSDGPYDENATLNGAPVGYSDPTKPGSNDMRDQFMVSATLNIVPTDRLRLRVSTNYTYTDHNTIQNNNNIYGTTSLIQMGKPEYVTYKNATGSVAFATARETTYRSLNNEGDNTTISLQASYKLADGLNLSGTFGMNTTLNKSTNLTPFGYAVDGKMGYAPQGALYKGKDDRKVYTMDVKGDYSKNFGDISTESVLGFQAFQTISKSMNGGGQQFPGPGLQVLGALGSNSAGSGFSEVIEAGMMMQTRVGYMDWLYATAGIRQDANSAFGAEFSTITYPRFNVSFIPTTMTGGSIGPMSTLRLRMAWGQAGQQPGAFDQYTTFLPWASEFGPGLSPGNVGDPSLKPEVSTEIEFGGEVGLLNDKLAIDFQTWSRVVEDALIQRAYPPSGGFFRTQLSNIGQIDASGWEAGVDATVIRSSTMSVDLFASISYLSEKVVSLGGAPEQKVGGSYPRYRNFLTEGWSPGSFFGAKLDRSKKYPIDTNGDGKADDDATLLAFFTSGGAGVRAGWNPVMMTPTQADVDAGLAKDTGALGWYLGKPTPDYSASFGTAVKVGKNWRVNVMFESRFGEYSVTNLTDAFRKSHGLIGRNVPEAAATEADLMDPAKAGQVRLDAANRWVREFLALSPYSGLNTIEDASFTRLRELSFAYVVDPEVAARFGARSLTLAVSGKNLWINTPYSGIDPELNAIARSNGGINDFQQSIDAFGVPIPSSWTLSLKVGM